MLVVLVISVPLFCLQVLFVTEDNMKSRENLSPQKCTKNNDAAGDLAVKLN